MSRPVSTIEKAILVLLAISLILSGSNLTLTLIHILGEAPSPISPEKQTLIIGTTDTIRFLAAESISSAIDVNIGDQIYERLVRNNPTTGKVEPALAESWTLSPDGKTYTFKIRKNVYFHDGAKLTAYAINETWGRIWNYINLGWYTTAKYVFPYVASFDAIDDYTFRVVVKNPFGPMMSIFATPYLNVNSPEHNDRDKDEFYGTGPWKFAHWIRDEEVELVRNDVYWRTDEKPKLNTIIWKIFKSASSLAMALKLGTIDVAWRNVAVSDLLAFQNDPNYEVIKQPPARLSDVHINRLFAPLQDIQIRQAMAYCINRTEIVEKAYKGVLAKAEYSMMPSLFPESYPAFEYTYGKEPNYTKAKQILVEAGYELPVELPAYIEGDGGQWGPEAIDAVTLIVGQLEKGGFKVNLQFMEYAAQRTLRGNKQIPLCGGAGGWIYDYFDGMHYLDNWFRLYRAQVAGVNESVANALLTQAGLEQNYTKRVEIYKEIQIFAAENVPMIPICSLYEFAITNKRLVKGFALSNAWYDTYFYNVEIIG